jgi:lipopolysaccharide/colanic/teichoic acid biosynthesis glycosyltransferase
MLHQEISRRILPRRRFQFAGAITTGALVPWIARGVTLPGSFTSPYGLNGLVGNLVAITIAFWCRLSLEVYPGIRQAYVILPAALTGHGLVVAWFVFTRFPYDRIAILLGFVLNVAWLYFAALSADRGTARIAVVPFGGVDRLFSVGGVQWVRLKRPNVRDCRSCDAIVADFTADLPDQWEAFLADCAVAGRIVYQHKQLAESLTGRVELERLSENSFGSLVPARGYFHLKGLIDVALAVSLLPLALPLMGIIALAIAIDDGSPVLFRQERVGYGGRPITVYKFRTMRLVQHEDERVGAMTEDGDYRVTRVGRVLRRFRLDELPQIFNILLFQMSWIGPRPEAKVLSNWYTSELPFYRYRHVVKPGISGWAQVNQGHVTDVSDVLFKLQYDFYYIKYFSAWLDLLILFKTVKTILTGFGSR